MRLVLPLGLAPAAAIGVGRFAYALVLPAMQADLNLSYALSGLVGSANTAGYLAGALVSHRVLGAVGYRRGLYGSLMAQTASLLLLVVAPDVAWIVALRFVQGVLGAFVFVGGAALLLASGARPLALGLYFGGVGIGIAASPLVLPLFSDGRDGWALLGLVSLALSLLAFGALPGLREPGPPERGPGRSLRPIAGNPRCGQPSVGCGAGRGVVARATTAGGGRVMIGRAGARSAAQGGTPGVARRAARPDAPATVAIYTGVTTLAHSQEDA